MEQSSQRKLAITLAAIFVVAASVGDAAEAGKPSFDCTKAKSVAEKMICADPGLAAADVAIAANYASAMKRLDAPARKALAQDQEDFVSYRDRIAGFDQGVPKDKQNFPIDEFMRNRAAFLGAIEKPDAGFVGSWNNVGGMVTIKSAGPGKLEIEADTANPSTGGSECNVGGVVKTRQDLELVDRDSDDRATGLVYRFRRLGDALEAEESGQAKGDQSEPASCGANGHVSGVFFLTRPKS
ncbi:MAG TPA: lysozyme inhibitor LprI family protein [Roseiarcus sp.]